MWAPSNILARFPFQTLPFQEDSPRLPCPDFYYTLEDIVFDTVKQKQGLTYSVPDPMSSLVLLPVV
jgi:hypothetical protein